MQGNCFGVGASTGVKAPTLSAFAEKSGEGADTSNPVKGPKGLVGPSVPMSCQVVKEQWFAFEPSLVHREGIEPSTTR